MLKKIVDPSELTEEYVRETFEEAYRIAKEKNKGNLILENIDNFPKDENGFIIMTEEQYKQYYPDAMPVDEFFEQLENSVKKGNQRLV